MIENEPFEGWIIKEILGQGAFGKVYRVEKEKHSSAVKQIVIPDPMTYTRDIFKFQGNKEALLNFYRPKVDRMKKEILIMQQLSGVHGIVDYKDHKEKIYNEYTAWELLIRMEYLIPLEKYIAENGMKIIDVLNLGIQLCRALEISCKKKIIHRDIKESNILIDNFGNFKLGDFGVARNLEGITHAQTKVGTFGYMAPEVLSGFQYDFRADMYALGIVLYKFLNDNQMPFMKRGGTISDLEDSNNYQKMGKTFPDPLHGGLEIAKSIIKACEFEANKRYSSFFEMGNVLNNILIKTDKKILEKYVVIPISKNTKEINENYIESNVNEIINKENKTVKFSKNEMNEKVTVTDNANEMNYYGDKIERKTEQNQDVFKNKSNNYKKWIIVFSLLFTVAILGFIMANTLKDKSNLFIFKKKPQATKVTPVVSTKMINRIMNLNINDYLEFGFYNKEPILWKCVDNKNDNFLIVSEYILSLKPFDAAESGQFGKGATDVEKCGSNIWSNSNLREWLNSEDEIVKYSTVKPDNKAVWKGYCPYYKEAGFLKNFSSIDKEKIKTVKYNDSEDKVFLLSEKDLKLYFKTDLEKSKKITSEAVELSNYKKASLKADYKWYYWTSSPVTSSGVLVSFVDQNGDFADYYNAYNGSCGVVPALYLKSGTCKTGKETKENPYKF
jgi:serine/threonine protein kinase